MQDCRIVTVVVVVNTWDYPFPLSPSLSLLLCNPCNPAIANVINHLFCNPSAILLQSCRSRVRVRGFVACLHMQRTKKDAPTLTRLKFVKVCASLSVPVFLRPAVDFIDDLRRYLNHITPVVTFNRALIIKECQTAAVQHPAPCLRNKA